MESAIVVAKDKKGPDDFNVTFKMSAEDAAYFTIPSEYKLIAIEK